MPLSQKDVLAVQKIQLCKHFLQRHGCRFGRNCSFAHSVEELKEGPTEGVADFVDGGHYDLVWGKGLVHRWFGQRYHKDEASFFQSLI